MVVPIRLWSSVKLSIHKIGLGLVLKVGLGLALLGSLYLLSLIGDNGQIELVGKEAQVFRRVQNSELAGSDPLASCN